MDITADYARKTTADRAKDIFTQHELLRGILDHHEATLQKRWMKKTKEQRRKILLAAWPEMPPTHRPDFVGLQTESVHQRGAGTRHREAFLTPFINQEDLTKTRTLLLFMNARGRSPPAAFANADGEAFHVGITSMAIQPAFLNNHVVMFTGRHTPETYGALINWDDHPDAFDWLMTRKGSNPGEALLILESQQRTMRGLVVCAKQILQDIPDESLLTGPVLAEPPSVSETGSGLGSLAVMAAEAPYRLPAKLNFAHIESLLAARRDAVKDKIWLMREDPSYFSDIMLDAREHRQEMIKDTRGKAHPLFLANREDVLWARVIGNEIVTPYLQLEMYSELHRQSEQLKSMQEKYSATISHEQDLPGPYLDAILKFQHYLKQNIKGPMGSLKTAFVASPPIRGFFVRVPEDNPNNPKIAVTSRPNVKLNKVEQQLIWLVRSIFEDGQTLFLAGLTNMVDELQRLIESDPKVKAMISSNIAALISDLSILCECLRQLEVFQPWANTFEDLMVDRKHDIQNEFAQATEPVGRILGALQGLNSTFASHGAPTEKRFFYPNEKRKTRENTEAMRRAEANLDLFWKKVDERTRATAGDLTNTALLNLLSETRSLQRTSEWVEPGSQPQEAPTSKALSLRPLSDVLFDIEHGTKQTTKTRKDPKIKQKTRGVAAPSTNSAQDLNEATVGDSQPRFAVDDRVLKVFRTIFYTPSTNGTPGEIPWTDFLHAMVSTGFKAEKKYGSAWQFSPSGLDVERSIQFHEPHPAGKIPYRIGRIHGRRLNRAYGLVGGMFYLAEKAAGGGNVRT